MYTLYKTVNGNCIKIGTCASVEAGCSAIEMDKKLHGAAERYEIVLEEKRS